MANLSEGFSQVKLDDQGTYGAYNQATNQAIAFPDMNTLNSFFGEGSTFNPNAPKANFDTSSLLGQNAGKVISINALSPASSLQVPQATPKPDALAPTVAGAEQTTKSLDQYIKELTPPETETSKQYDKLFADINTLLPSTTGRGQAQLQAEQDAGLPGLKKQLAEINAQLLQKVAEATKTDMSYEQMIANLENPANAQQLGIPMSAIIGQQAQARKMQLAERNSKAADIGLLNAYAIGLQGNVQAMQSQIDRAIDLKYQDKESELNIKLQQLELLEGKLTKEEAIVKQALERKYADEQAKIAEDKAKAKENVSLAFAANAQTKFVNKNGEFFRTSDGKPYERPEDFFKDAGVTSFEQAYQRGLVTDVNAGRLADIDFVQQLRAKYPDAGIVFTDSPDSAVDKLSRSNIYFKDNYIASQAGSDNIPKPTSINGQDYFFDPATGQFVSAGDFTNNNNNGNQPAFVSNSGGQLKLTGTQADTLAGFNNTAQSSARALQLLSEGVKTGPVAGRTLNAKKLIGKADPKELELEQLLSQIKANFTKALSGAAVSEQEVKRLSKFLPDNNDQESVIKSKLNTLIQQVTQQKTNFLDALGGQENPNFIGPRFNSAGNASASNQVKGVKETVGKLPTINPNTFSSSPDLYSAVKAKFQDGTVGGQCGDYVRKVANTFGLNYPSLGDSLKSKTQAVQKYGTSISNARPGSVIVTKENPTYGHVAMIIGVTKDGYIVSESNFKQSNKISTGRVIPFNSPKIIGIINPTI